MGSDAFLNISESEINHMARMKLLIDKYQLKDPVENNADKRGAIDNQQLKKIHDELITSGKTSLEEAFRAGEKMEEVDIRDLKEAMAKSIIVEIKSTYTGLTSASENHLRAFVRNLKRLDINYTPVVIDKEVFDAIMKNQQGKGMGMGKGMGQGNGNRQCKSCEKPSQR
jgi:rubrerythrin